jgi:uncharacterized protein involved in outer membrane biogenesis
MTALKRKLLLGFGLFVALLVAAVIAGIVMLDDIARYVAEKRMREQSGMDATIGELVIGLRTPTVTIRNFKLTNPPDFGGSPFVEIPEIYFEYDREALRAGRLHFKLVRLNLAQVHVVEKGGKSNVQALQKTAPEPRGPSKPGKEELPFEFAGIDKLQLTLTKAVFTKLGPPDQTREVPLGVQNEVFRDIKTQRDVEAIAAIIALRTGATALLQNPGTKRAGGGARNLFENLAIPAKP